MNQSDQEILQDVLDTPANDEGDGFVVLGVWAMHTVGSDGRIYARQKGKVTVELQAEA